MIDATERKETNAEYHADYTHYSHSMLEAYYDDPQAYRDIFVTKTRPPKPPTEAMTFGSAVHSWVLEGIPPNKLYGIVKPPLNPKTGKPYGTQTNAHANYMASLDPSREYLTKQQCVAVYRIRAQIEAHKRASRFLCAGGETEKVVRWTRDGGTKCRAKPDRVVPPTKFGGLRVIADVKTAADPTLEGFIRATINFGYHRQAAWYLDYFASDPDPTEFVFIVAGSDEPYDVYVHELEESFIETGRRENIELLRRIKESIKTDVWTRPEQREINTILEPRWYREIMEPEK